MPKASSRLSCVAMDAVKGTVPEAPFSGCGAPVGRTRSRSLTWLTERRAYIIASGQRHDMRPAPLPSSRPCAAARRALAVRRRDGGGGPRRAHVPERQNRGPEPDPELDGGFEVSLDTIRREAANDNDAEHGVMVSGALRW